MYKRSNKTYLFIKKSTPDLFYIQQKDYRKQSTRFQVLAGRNPLAL